MSDIQARREARMRKILENSEIRLQRITGVQQRNASYELEGFKSSQNNIENESSIETHVHSSNGPNRDSPSRTQYNTPQVETLYRNPVFNSPSFLDRTSVSSAKQLTFTKTYRIPIIIGIACLFNSLQLVFEGQDFLLLNKIFLPLLCFEAIYLFYNQNSETNNEITNILHLFCRNIPPHYLSIVIKYFTLFITITKDVMIYFFTYVFIWFILRCIFNTLQGI